MARYTTTRQQLAIIVYIDYLSACPCGIPPHSFNFLRSTVAVGLLIFNPTKSCVYFYCLLLYCTSHLLSGRPPVVSRAHHVYRQCPPGSCLPPLIFVAHWIVSALPPSLSSSLSSPTFIGLSLWLKLSRFSRRKKTPGKRVSCPRLFVFNWFFTPRTYSVRPPGR